MVTPSPARWELLSENAFQIQQNVSSPSSPAMGRLGFLLDIHFLSSVSTGAALFLNYVLE